MWDFLWMWLFPWLFNDFDSRGLWMILTLQRPFYDGDTSWVFYDCDTSWGLLKIDTSWCSWLWHFMIVKLPGASLWSWNFLGSLYDSETSWDLFMIVKLPGASLWLWYFWAYLWLWFFGGFMKLSGPSLWLWHSLWLLYDCETSWGLYDCKPSWSLFVIVILPVPVYDCDSPGPLWLWHTSWLWNFLGAPLWLWHSLGHLYDSDVLLLSFKFEWWLDNWFGIIPQCLKSSLHLREFLRYI